MQWMVNWFQQKEGEWKRRLGDVTNDGHPPGLDCYCHKQIAIWGTLANQADTKFSSLMGSPLFR